MHEKHHPLSRRGGIFPLSPGHFFRTIAIMMLRRLLLPILAVFALSATAPSAQSDRGATPSKDRVAYRQLTWADFHVDDTATGLSAQTQTFLSYVYKARSEKDPVGNLYTASVAKIDFAGGFDRAHSWRRSTVHTDNMLLLRHEQGHLDINELKLRQLQNLELAELPRVQGATAKGAVDALDKRLRILYRWHLDDLEKTQKRYDKETNFGTDRPVQQEWNDRLDGLIVRTNPSTAPTPLPVASAR